MNAAEIIREIEHLSLPERAKVMQFTNALHDRKLAGAELTELTERMVTTDNPAEADRIQEELIRGFYGRDPGASALADGQLTGRELGVLTKQMVETSDPAEKAALKEQIVRGFYGDVAHA